MENPIVASAPSNATRVGSPTGVPAETTTADGKAFVTDLANAEAVVGAQAAMAMSQMPIQKAPMTGGKSAGDAAALMAGLTSTAPSATGGAKNLMANSTQSAPNSLPTALALPPGVDAAVPMGLQNAQQAIGKNGGFKDAQTLAALQGAGIASILGSAPGSGLSSANLNASGPAQNAAGLAAIQAKGASALNGPSPTPSTAIDASGVSPDLAAALGIEMMSVEATAENGEAKRGIKSGKASDAIHNRMSTEDFLNLGQNLHAKNLGVLPPATAVNTTAVNATAAIAGTKILPALSESSAHNAKFGSGLLDASAMAGAAPLAAGMSHTAQPEMTAGVVVSETAVKGSGAQRLSNVSVEQLGQQINRWNQNQEAGEMKIRLRPDHLGELFIQVNSLGRQVELKVKANSENSKRILEESMSLLKDSLAQKNLTLASVDFSISAPPTSSPSLNVIPLDSNPMMGQWDQSSAQSQRHGASDHANSEYKDFESGRSPGLKTPAAVSAPRVATGPGRLNVIG